MIRARLRTPLVSVLVPAFRASAYIRDAVASVLAQSYSNLEVLVSPDDGDSYAALRAAVTCPRLRILPPAEEGTGPGPARNRAIDAARGEFFAICDADDLWPSNYLATLLPLAEEAGAACAPTRYTDWEGHLIRELPTPPATLSVAGHAQLLASVHPVVHREVEPGYTSLFAEDVLHDLQVVAELDGQVPLSNETHYQLRRRPGSQTQLGKANEQAAYSVYTRHADAARHHPTRLGLQRLAESQRLAIAEAFDFRGYVSRRFEQSSESCYHGFVGGQEARLWDEFQAARRRPRTLLAPAPPPAAVAETA